MEFRIEEKGAFRVVGLRIGLEREMEKNFNAVPELWNRAVRDGSLERLLCHADCGEVLGVSVCLDEPWSYYIAVPSGSAAPDGFEEYLVEGGVWAVFEGMGKAPEAVQQVVKRALTEWLPASGYEYAPRAEFERYLSKDPSNAVFEYWLPIRRPV